MNIRFLPFLALLITATAEAQTQMHSPKTSHFEGHNVEASETWLATGRLALLMDQPMVAVERLVEAVAENPENTDALVLLGDIARTDSRLELAAKFYELAISVDPSLVDATLWTSRYRSLSGETDSAIDMLDRALIDNPTNPSLLLAQGHLLLEQGDSFGALDYLLTAQEVAPDLFDVNRLLGLALMNTRQWEASESAYRQALSIRDDLNVHIELAQVYDASSAAPQRALDHLLYVLEHEPDHVTALSMAGDILVQLDNTTAAQNVWRRAIRIAPDFCPALNNYGRMKAREGRTEAAIELYTQCLESHPDFIAATLNRAQAQVELGQCSQAHQTLDPLVAQQNDLGAAAARRLEGCL